MKIVVFSDLHGNNYSLEEFKKQMIFFNPDKIIFLGDVFGYYYGQKSCIEYLKNQPNLLSIKGNHDQLYLESRENPLKLLELSKKYGNTYLMQNCLSTEDLDFVNKQPVFVTCFVDGIKIAFCHGSLDNLLEGRVYPDTIIHNTYAYSKFDYVFLGHTHHKMLKLIGNSIVCNPGSLGQQRDGMGCSYILFDTLSKEMKWMNVKYDAKALVEDIRHNDPKNDKLIEVLLRNNK